VNETPAAASDIPVFSERLDTLMAAMLDGEAPNVGRFCGYCYTPLGKKADTCSHCGRASSQFEPVAKIPADFFDMYGRMRKRESLIVNSFAFAGLGIGLILFIVLVAIAVYRFDQSLWMLAGATAVLIVGGRVFAGLLGGWIGDSIGYDFAHRRLVLEWTEYERAREERLGRVPADAR
jgi:hypothetical protein